MNTASFTRTSTLLEKLTAELNGKCLTVNDLLTALGKRSFGFIILLFSIPNALPVAIIPGFSALCGIIVLLTGLQMIFARPVLWLPYFIGKKVIPTSQFITAIQKSMPYLKKIERWVRPRWPVFSSTLGERVLGLIISFLALLLMLPIPFSNMVLGLLISISAIGLIEGDGLMILVGWAGASGWLISLIIFFRFLL